MPTVPDVEVRKSGAGVSSVEEVNVGEERGR